MELSDDLYTEIRKTLGLSETEIGEPPIAPGESAKARARTIRRVSRADASRARAEIELPGTLTPAATSA
jgi:hypothetical protein